MYDARGRVLRRYVGFAEPVAIAPLAAGHYLVADRADSRIVELDLDGAVHWSVRMPDPFPGPRSASRLPSGNVLVAADYSGVVELDVRGSAVWSAPSPIPGNPVTGAVRLPDGSTVVTIRDSHRTLYRIAAGRQAALELSLEVEHGARNEPRVTAWNGDGRELVLWDRDWAKAYRAAVPGRSVRLLGEFDLPRSHDIVPDGNGGCAYVTEDFIVGRWWPGREATSFKTVFEPLAVAPVVGTDRVLVGFVRVPDASWPESRRNLNDIPRFDWLRSSAWLVGGVLVAVALQMSARARRRRRPPATTSDEKPESSQPPAPPLPAVRLAAIAAFIAGLALAGFGHYRMTHDFGDGWLTCYVGGAALAAASLELWRRRVLGTPDRYWQAVAAAEPDLSAWPELLAGSVLVLAGGAALFRWRLQATNYPDQVGLWAAMLVVLAALAILPSGTRTLEPRALRAELRCLALPLGVGVVTLFYRLRDVPAFMHFDFAFCARTAWELMHGYMASIWDPGFVPVPVIGLVPEMTGLALAGPGEIGFRLGGSLFGLTGVVAVYLLGRCYRGRRTGILAATLLAGSIPFIHFSRLNANGNAATAALWTVTLVALAIKHAKPGLWVGAGLAAGYCFYLWPGARVAVAASALAFVLLFLRSPRVMMRRRVGGALMLVAFSAWIAPVLSSWMQAPSLVIPRVEESMEAFRPSVGVQWDRLKASFGAPLAQSFGWFFVTTDNSTQGTLSPGCNAVEAVLLAVGLAVVLTEGFSLNVLLLVYAGLVLVTLGAFASSPPWYTRLVPSAPVAAILAARVLDGALDLLAFASDRTRRTAFGLVAAATVALSPATNLRTYVRFETGQTPGAYPKESLAIGPRLRELGPRFHFYLVSTKRPDWGVNYLRPTARFGELLPYIWNLHVSEIRELETRLPLPAGEAAALVVQAERFDEDVGVIRRFYPNAKVERLLNCQAELAAGLVVVPKT